MLRSCQMKLLGYVGVDTGRLLISDPCYLQDEITKEKIDAASGTFTEQRRYAQLKYKMGHDGAGVIVSGGFGDGTYPVYGEIADDGIVTKIIIDFEGSIHLI